MKKKYLKNEIWSLTFGGAFQRAKVYKDNAAETAKLEFKINTREFIESKLLPQYRKKKLMDATHIRNIVALSDFTKKHSRILKGGKLNFGVSQKLLNLQLKYLWCLDEITEPPHFPVDRVIQERLKIYPITSWTKFKDHKEYMHIITEARKQMGPFNSIAELELHLFERRMNTSDELT